MNKSILITGGSGFIGHYLIEYFLANSNFNIISIDKNDKLHESLRLKDILKNLSNLEKKRLKLIKHNLRDELTSKKIKKMNNINIIIHLAADTDVDNSILNPKDCIYDNIIGTLNVLNFAKRLENLENIIHFSTFEVFGPALKNVNFSEYDRYNSINPYAASKAGAEEIAVAFENCFSLPISIIHTMNVFGFRQDPKKFIPSTIKKIRDNEKIYIHSDIHFSNPGSRRYIHVNDLADGINFLINYDFSKIKSNSLNSKCNKFNLVGLEEINNLELAQKIASIQGKILNYEMVNFHEERPGHNLRFSLSGDKMKSLGWKPKSFKKNLIKVVEKYLANPEWLLIR